MDGVARRLLKGQLIGMLSKLAGDFQIGFQNSCLLVGGEFGGGGILCEVLFEDFSGDWGGCCAAGVIIEEVGPFD